MTPSSCSAARIDGLALDILDRLVRARWDTRRAGHLADADGDLAVLRTLLRLSCDRQYPGACCAYLPSPRSPGDSPTSPVVGHLSRQAPSSGLCWETAVLRDARSDTRNRLLDRAALEALARSLDEAGRMLGGWRRSLGGP